MARPQPSRREILKWGALGLGVTALGGCTRVVERLSPPLSPAELPKPIVASSETHRLVNRLGFGPSPLDFDVVSKLEPKAYIGQQLAADQEEPTALEMRLRRLDITQFSPYDLRDLPEEVVLQQLVQAAILRAVYSPNQLLERMVNFWTDHFNIFGRKGLAAFRKAEDERSVIRAHALGKFPAMLTASARSTAMLVYLDNQQNRSGIPNENYARELLELHTLGVDGGYTYQDIREVARCFTGWSEERRFMRPRGSFRFIESLHDSGEKEVLGHRIPAGGGEKDGLMVLNILAEHPSTARHLSNKLCQVFIGDPPTKLVDEMSKVYLESKGDIRLMLRAIFESKLLLNGPPLLKRPFDYMVSSLRATAAETDGSKPLQAHLEAMGQPLYQWPMPDGYPVQQDAWSSGLLARWNFAWALANREIKGTHMAPLGKQSTVSPALFGIQSQAAFDQAANPNEALALMLMSPEFQWR